MSRTILPQNISGNFVKTQGISALNMCQIFKMMNVYPGYTEIVTVLSPVGDSHLRQGQNFSARKLRGWQIFTASLQSCDIR